MTTGQTLRRSRRPGRGLLAVAAALGTVSAGALALPAQASPGVLGTFGVTLVDGVLTIEGGPGRDSMVVAQTAAGALTLNGVEVRSGPGPVEIGDVALIRLDGGGGDDTLRFLPPRTDSPSTEMSGGDGNDVLQGGPNHDRLDGGRGIDTINGGAGADEIVGGDGSDRISGGVGVDLVQAGEGSDQLAWQTGDGGDVLDGGGGTDTLRLDGSAAGQVLTFEAAGRHVIVSPDRDAPALVLSGVERVDADLAGGVYTTVVNDLTGSDLGVLRLTHGGAADTGEDVVIVAGTSHADRVRLFGPSPGGPPTVTVGNVVPTVLMTGAERLTLLGQGGDDVLDAARLPGGIVRLTASGDDGDDTLIGTPGDDRLFGGPGDDRVEGRGGAGDVLDGGPGTNVVIP